MLLQGTRVIDLSRLLPGGYCTQLLRQHGAQVVKVEPPAGDPLRRMAGGEALFATLHEGKQLMVIDLQRAEGRTELLRQAGDADVLVEGFRPGRMERFELGYETLSRINPRLVYCAITGYGSGGPLAARAGHDLNYLARSGALSLMPRLDSLPFIPGVQIADMAGGLQAAFLIAAALLARSTSGRGARVEVSMAGLMKTWTAPSRAVRAAGLPGLGLTGEYPCYHVYATRDGAITVAALEPKFWEALCRAVEREDLIGRQFDGSAIGELEGIFSRAPRSHWLDRFAGLDVCVEPVLALEEGDG